MPTIVLESGTDQKKAFRFKNFVLIGRDSVCNVWLSDPQVSDIHAVLVRGMDGFYLMDVGSSTGTFIGDQAVSSARLDPNDVFQIGGTLIQYLQEEGLFPARESAANSSKEQEAASSESMEISPAETGKDQPYEETAVGEEFSTEGFALPAEGEFEREGVESSEAPEYEPMSEEESAILEEAALAAGGSTKKGRVKQYATSFFALLLWLFVSTNFLFGSYLMGQYVARQVLR